MERKMIKKTTKIAALFALLVSVIFCGIMGIVLSKNIVGNADEPTTNVTLKTSYDFGETLKVPSNVKITCGEKTYDATSYVVYPNGDIHKGNAYALTSYGEYTLVSEAATEEGTLSTKQTFSVSSDYYAVGTEKSSFSYGTLGYGSTKGLQLKLAEGDTFYFNDPIDIYENTWTDLVTFSILQDDTTKLKFLTFRMTDCYDSSNYIEMTFKRYDYNYENFIVASANGGRAAGFINPKGIDKGELEDPTQLKVSANGTGVDGNYYSTATGKPVYVPIRYSLDTTNRKNIKCYVTVVGYESQNVLVAEFNNDKIFDYPFHGFKNGKVFLSVTASSLIAVETAEVHISSVAGIGTEKDFLKASKYDDCLAPLIVVDAPLETADIVAGCKLQIPTAKAYDESGLQGDIDYTVWYNYGKDNAFMVKVENGEFLPESKGVYSIVYNATDVFGNVAEKVLTLNAVKVAEKGIVFDCQEQKPTEAGVETAFNAYTVDSLNGGVSVEISVAYPDGSVYTTKDTDKVFLLEQVGQYTVTYDYQDYFYTGSYSYSFTTAASSKPSFANSFRLPKYFIKDATYTIEDVNAYFYAESGVREVETVKEVSFDGGAFENFDSKSFQVTGNQTVQFRYSCKDASEVVCLSERISVVDVNYKTEIQKNAYFVGEGISSTIDTEKSTYTATENGDKNLDFINPVLLSSFEFQFKSDASIGGVTLVLTDYYNRSNRLTIALSGEKNVSINGGSADVLANVWKGNTLSVLYNDGTVIVGSNNVQLRTLPTFEYCLFSIELNGVQTGATFDVYKLQNQFFNDIMSMDRVAPTLSADLPEKVCSINEEITLGKAFCADVLSPSALQSCILTVESPDGEYLLDCVSASDNEYKLKLTEYGEYYVCYEYMDGAGNVGVLEHYVHVFDFVAPTIELVNYTAPVDVVLGQELTPIEYRVSDDITAADGLIVYCLVYDEKGAWISSRNNEGTSFILREAGVYTVYLYCIDEAGNTSFVSYQVKAK